MAWWFYVTSPLQCLFRFFRFLAPKKHEESRKRPLQNIRPTEVVDRPARKESETLCKDVKESYNAVGNDITKNISNLYDTNSQEERIIPSSEEVEQNIQSSIIGLSEEYIQAHSSDDKIVNDNFNSSKERKSADVDDFSQERATMSQDNFSQTSSHKELTEYLHLNVREEDYVARSAVGFGKLELISRMLTEQTTSEADEGNQMETQIEGFSSDSIEYSEVVSINPEDHNCPTNQTDNNFIAKPKTEIKVVGATMKKSVITPKTEDTEIQNIQKQVLEEDVNEIDTYDEQNVIQRTQRTDSRACEDSKAASINNKILINELKNYSISLLEQVESPEKTKTEQLLKNTMNYNAKCDQSHSIEMVVTKSISSEQEEKESPANIASEDDFTDTLLSNERVITDSNSKNELTEPSLDVLAIDDSNRKIPIFENEANEKLIMHSTNELSILNQDAPGLETESSITADESCDSDSASTDSDSTFKFSDSEKEIDKQEKKFSHKDDLFDDFQNSQTNEKAMKLGNESMQTSSSAPETRADLSGYEMVDNSKEVFVGLSKEANLKEVYTYLIPSSINNLCKSEIKSAEPDESIAADLSHELLMLLNKTKQWEPASVTLEEPLLEFKITITNSTKEPTTLDIENHTSDLHHYGKEKLYDDHVTTDNKNSEKCDQLESNSTCDSHDYDTDKTFEGGEINDNKNYKKDDVSESNPPHDAHEHDKEKTDKLESKSTCDSQDNVNEIAYEGNATIDNKIYEKYDNLDSNTACDFQDYANETAYAGNATIDNKNYEKDDNLDSNIGYDLHDYDEGKENEGSVTINNKNYENDNKMEVNSACGVYDSDIEKIDERNVKIDNKKYKNYNISDSNPSHDAHEHDKEKTDKLESNSTCDFQDYVNEIAYDGNAKYNKESYEKDDNLKMNSTCDFRDHEENKIFEDNVTTDYKIYEDNEAGSNSTFDVHEYDKEKAYEVNATIDDKNYEKNDHLNSNIACDLHDYDEGKENKSSITINNKNYEKDNKVSVNTSCGVYDNDIETTDESNVKIEDINYNLNSTLTNDFHDYDEVKDNECSVVINNKNYAEGHVLEINSSIINKNLEKDDKMEDNSTCDDYDKEKTYEGDLIIDKKKNEHEKLESSSTLGVQNNTKNTTDLEYNESEIKNSNDTIKILFCNLSSQIKEVVFDDSVTMNSGFESVNKQQEEKINDLAVHEPYSGLSDAKSEQKEKNFYISTTSFSSRLIPIKYDSNHKHEFGKQESDWEENSEAGKLVTQVNVNNTNFDKVINETKITDSVVKISPQENFTSEQIINSVHLESSDQGSHLMADEIMEHVHNKSILLDSTEKVNDEFLNSEHDMSENKMEIFQTMDSIVEGVNKDLNFNLPCESLNDTHGQNQQEEIVLGNNESSKITDSLEFLLSKCDIEDKQPSDDIHLNPVKEFLDLENEKMKESLNNLSEKDIILKNEINEQSLMNSNCMQNLNISGSNCFQDINVSAKDVMATNLMCENEVEKSEDSKLVAILDSGSQQGSILGSDSNCEIVILDQNTQDSVEKDAEANKCEDLIYENNSNGQEKNYWKINSELHSPLGCKSEKQDSDNLLHASNENQTQTELKIKATELTLEAPLNPDESSILELEKPESNDKKAKMDTDDFLPNDSQNEFSTLVIQEPTSEICEQSDATNNTIVIKSCHDFRDEEEPMDYECLQEDSFDSHVIEEDLKPVEGDVIEKFLDKVEQFNSPEDDTSLRRRNKLPSSVQDRETNSQDKRRGMMNLYYDEEEMEVDEIFIEKQTIPQLYDDVQEASISSENKAKRIGNVLFPNIEISKDSPEKPILLAECEPFSEIKSKRLGFIRLSSNEELQAFDELLLSDKKQIAIEKKVSFSKTGEIQRPIDKTPPFDFVNQKFFSTPTKNNVEKILEEPSTTGVLNIRTTEEVTNESQMEEFKCSFSLEEPLTDTITKETIMEVLPQNNDTERIMESVESAPAPNINHEIVCKNLNGKVPSFEIRHKTDERLPMLTLSQITDKLQDTEKVNSAPPITNEVREAVNDKLVGGAPLFGPGNKPNVGAPLFSVAQKSDKEQDTESGDSAPPIYEKHKVVNKDPIKRVPLLGLKNKPNKGASLFTLPQKPDAEQETDRNDSAYQTIVKHEVDTKKHTGELPLLGLGHKPCVGISMFALPQQTSANNDAKCLGSAPFISVEQESIRKKPVGGVALFGLGHKPVGGVSMFKLPQKSENDRDTDCLDSAPFNDKEHKSVCKIPAGGVPLFGLGHKLVEEIPKFIAKKHNNSNETTPPFTGDNIPISKKPIGGIPLFGLGHKPFTQMLNCEEKKIPVGGVKLFGGSELTAKLKGRREKLNEDNDHDTTPSPLVDNEPGYFPPLNEALANHTSKEPQCSNGHKRKPVGGVSLFDGNEFQEKLKARRGKLSAEDDNHLSHINENKIMKKQNVDDLHNTLTSDDKSVDNFFHRFDIISKTTIYGDEDIELSLEDFDKEKNILEHVNKSRPKGPLNRRPRQTHSRKEGKHR